MRASLRVMAPIHSLPAKAASEVRILKSEGVETWHPRFSYYGFRYIQVEGAVLKGQKNPFRLPVIQKIQSCFVYNSAPKISTFECSNRIFNDAHRLIEKAVRSNMQSVFTDCPHREKLGWLEQDHLCGPGLLYNYDLTGFVPQTLQNIADAQHANGAVPTTIMGVFTSRTVTPDT
jgi:alpha-L-rhamnosidase